MACEEAGTRLSARPEAAGTRLTRPQAAAGPLCRDMGDDLASEGDSREWGRGGSAPQGRGAQRPEGRFVWRGREGAGGAEGQSRDALKK